MSTPREKAPAPQSAAIVRHGALVPAPVSPPPGPTLAHLVPAFLKWFQFIRRRSDNTVRSYGEDLKSFLTFCASPEAEAALGYRLERPAQINFRHLEFYLGWLQKERGVKPQTANRHLHALRTFWQYLTREGLAATNPAADCFMLPAQKKLPSYLTIAEQERLLTVLAENPSLPSRRDHALVATALFTGLRCAELANLQLAHVDLHAGRLRVVNGKGGKDRELPIIPRLEAILQGYLAEVRPALVGRPFGGLHRNPGSKYWWLGEYAGGGKTIAHKLTTESLEEARRIRAERVPQPSELPWVFVNASPTNANRIRRAGQPILGRTIFHMMRRVVSPILGRPVAPHMLRHSFASRLRENGADLQLIQEALGHASMNTTTMYAHLTTNRRRQDLARLLEKKEDAS